MQMFPSPRPDATGSQASTTGGTMLIADDEALIRWALRQQFSSSFTIVEAGSVAEASELIRDLGRGLRVTLLDLQMPDGTGLLLLDLLRAHAPTCMVVVITACSDEQLLAQARASGAKAVLAKPVEIPTLRRTLNLLYE